MRDEYQEQRRRLEEVRLNATGLRVTWGVRLIVLVVSTVR